MTMPARTPALFISTRTCRSPAHPRRFCIPRNAMAAHACMLGDLFEYWAGDDDLGPFQQRIGAGDLRGKRRRCRRVLDRGQPRLPGGRRVLRQRPVDSAGRAAHVVEIGGQRSRWCMATPNAGRPSTTWHFAPRCAIRHGAPTFALRCAAQRHHPACAKAAAPRTAAKSYELMDGGGGGRGPVRRHGQHITSTATSHAWPLHAMAATPLRAARLGAGAEPARRLIAPPATALSRASRPGRQKPL